MQGGQSECAANCCAGIRTEGSWLENLDNGLRTLETANSPTGGGILAKLGMFSSKLIGSAEADVSTCGWSVANVVQDDGILQCTGGCSAGGW